MKKKGNTITATKGKVLRRISNKEVVGETYTLGYIHYLDGALLPEPLLEVAEDFEEVTEEQDLQERKVQYPILVEQYIREKYTVSDELAILRQRETKQAEFQEYWRYCESRKTMAKRKLDL